MSPPEFPAWSAENTTIVVEGVPGLEGFVDTELLRTYLNVHDSPSEGTQEDHDTTYGGNNSVVPLAGGNVDVNTMSANALKGGNENSAVTPLMGGNNTDNPSGPDDSLYPNNINDASPDYVDVNLVLDPAVEPINPTSLLKNCIQKLQEHVVVKTPMSLAHCCIDFMTWNWDTRFGINMLLPNTMSTTHSVAEIRRACVPTLSRSPEGLVNFGNKTIERSIHDYWLKDVSHRKYEVHLQKLTSREISLWDKSVKPDAWKDIDPYSDLEDVGSTSNKNPLESKDSQHDQDAIEKYDLRTRSDKSRIPSTRPQRMASASAKYTQSDSDSDIVVVPRKKPCKPRVEPSGPSTTRIAARGRRSVAPTTTHPIKMHQPKG